MSDVPLTPADPKNLRQAVSYALRFNERGKAHGVRMRYEPEMMADAVVKHLARSGYRFFEGPPLGAHTAGPITPLIHPDPRPE